MKKDFKLKGKLCSEWKVDELKKALKRRKEKVSGTKSELCVRLKQSLKTKISQSSAKVSKHSSSIKFKYINIQDPFFRYYISMYFQCPGSTLALTELGKYGLSKDRLSKYNNIHSILRNLV